MEDEHVWESDLYLLLSLPDKQTTKQEFVFSLFTSLFQNNNVQEINTGDPQEQSTLSGLTKEKKKTYLDIDEPGP